MAQTTMTLTLENDLVNDVIDALRLMTERLPKRHGDEFRRLERRWERITEGERPIRLPGLKGLGGGRFIVMPPKELLDLVNDAARLGVI